MSKHPRAAAGSFPGGPVPRGSVPAGSVPAAPHGAPTRLVADDELEQRITRALRSRDVSAPDVAMLVDRIESRLDAVDGQDDQLGTVTHLARRGGKAVAAGVVISALAVYGAGAAAAANPYSDGARALENVAHAVGLDWSAMPAGYTREQYDAFWGAGFTADDLATLDELWKTDGLETKAHAGQLLLDGATLPITPGAGGHAADGSMAADDLTPDRQEAFWGAGYTVADVATLSTLWNSDNLETKAHAGQMILDGEALPITPSGTAHSDAGS